MRHTFTPHADIYAIFAIPLIRFTAVFAMRRCLLRCADADMLFAMVSLHTLDFSAALERYAAAAKHYHFAAKMLTLMLPAQRRAAAIFMLHAARATYADYVAPLLPACYAASPLLRHDTCRLIPIRCCAMTPPVEPPPRADMARQCAPLY